MNNQKKKALTILAISAVLVLLLGVGVMAYNSPYSYVSLDVNPSFEFTVNIFNRVIQVNAVNDDASEILNELGVKELDNKEISDAVSKALIAIADKGYITDKEGGVVIATSEEKLAKKLETTVNALLENELNEDEKPILVTPEPSTTEEPTETTVPGETTEPVDPTEEPLDPTEEPVESTEPTIPVDEEEDDDDDRTVVVVCIGKDRVKRARELGVTPGKLNIVEKLEAAMKDDNFDIDEWLNRPVKDIMKTIKDIRKGEYLKDETPVAEEPQTEEPQTEEPQTEEPQTEEPQTEEPKTEEPKTEEPKTENTKEKRSDCTKDKEQIKNKEQKQNNGNKMKQNKNNKSNHKGKR